MLSAATHAVKQTAIIAARRLGIRPGLSFGRRIVGDYTGRVPGQFLVSQLAGQVEDWYCSDLLRGEVDADPGITSSAGAVTRQLVSSGLCRVDVR
jgi:hypothetical protein